MAKEALGGGRAVGATDVVVVYGGECRELAVAQAMATMVVEGQLAITARHPGTAALETIGTVTGHLFQVRAFGARQGVERMVALADAANPDLLAGIFGDSPWTNRERLPDETLKNLIEHFSTQTLSVANVPEDELGNAYEFLIKKFADDSGHTAAEFYTNRTVVHLMTQLLAPQAGESIYDPTCGTGGMLISALDEVKRSGRRIPHAQALRAGAQPHHLRHRPHEPLPARRRGLPDHPRRHPGRAAHIEGDRLRRSTSSSPTRRTPSSSGTARRGRRTSGAATSSARRRRAAPTTPSSSTSWPA
jgi:hypothetical protein